MNRLKNIFATIVALLAIMASGIMLVSCDSHKNDAKYSALNDDEYSGVYYRNDDESIWIKIDADGWTDSSGRKGKVGFENGILIGYSGDDVVFNATVNGNGMSYVSTSSGSVFNYVRNADPDHDHVYDEWTVSVKPTCTEEGEERRVCLLCGEAETKTLSALGHKITHVSRVEPTCMHSGNIEYWQCSVCMEKFGDAAGTKILTETGIPSVKHNFVNGSCTVCGADEEMAGKFLRVGDDGMPSADGNYILFGSYPQTKISDGALIESLNGLAGDRPTAADRKTWVSYGYYASGSVSEYMWYKDVVYDGDKYRGVYFTRYRPFYTSYDSTEDKSNQDDNGYAPGVVYWFKYEPIKWRITTSDKSVAVLICQTILDSRDFYAYDTVRQTTSGIIYPNNWEYSTVRTWLNGIFAESAFDEVQKSLLITSELDNKTTAFDGANNIYAAAQKNTADKIYLVSNKELFGFSFTESNAGYSDVNKIKTASDYAKAQGVYTDAEGNGLWWLRSASTDSERIVEHTDSEGYVYSGFGVNHTSTGIVPMLKLRICVNHHTDENCYCAECGATEHKLSGQCVCSQCGKTVHTVYDCQCIVCKSDIHNLHRNDEKAADCENPGHGAYWDCVDCHKIFADASGKTELDKIPEIKALGHTFVDCICTRCGYEKHNYENCVCKDCGKTDHDMEECVCIKCGYTNHIGTGEYCRHDDYIYFGSYPQSEITDASLIRTLSSLAGNLPTSGYDQAWTSYGYYVNSNSATNYMWYKDVEYSGNKYRGVYFISYRPDDVKGNSLPDDSNQDENGYIKNSVYWFIYEPVKWRILTDDGESALLLCENIIDSREYYADLSDRAGIGATDWENSSVREWLNTEFAETAFNEMQLALLNTIAVNNKTTAIGGAENEYAASQNNTQDKVYLLSYSEALNEEYGFLNRTDSDVAKVKTSTNYAKAQGGSDGIWRLRSPYNGTETSCIDVDGGIDIKRAVNYTSVGLVPVIRLTLCTEHTPNENCVCTKCGYIEHELNGGKCVRCGKEIYRRINENGESDPNGEYINFGKYPQSKVTDIMLTSALNGLAGTLPTAENNRKWQPYGYYVRNVVSNYMWYIDVDYNGEKYRGVYFIGYRPQSTTFNSSADTSDQNENDYIAGRVYWFKFEELKWKILFEEDGVATVMAVTMIDGREFQAEYSYNESNGFYSTKYGNAPEGTSANSWEYSTVREWLNNTFAETAFSVYQKMLISLTDNVDVNTKDYIYLLSEDDINNPKYGFSPEKDDEDKKLIMNASEYAKAQGLYMYSDLSKMITSGQWWIRSADAERTEYAGRIGLAGGTVYDNVTYTNVGIVPAFRIILCDGHDTENCVCTKCGQEVHDTDENCVCSTCGKEFHILYDCVCVLCGEISHTPQNCVCTSCGLTAHTLVKHSTVEAKCEETGTREYYECTVCGLIFADENAVVSIEEITLAAKGHTVGADGRCVICGKENIGLYQRVNKDGIPDSDGDYFYYGIYPQTKVSDANIVSALNTAAGDVASWNYYKADAIGQKENYMRYTDVTLNGIRYRGIYILKYKPYTVSEAASDKEGNQKRNGYEKETAYWFVYEPVKWRMLDSELGAVILLCENVLDSKEFAETGSELSNGWETSFIRKTLNSTFIDMTFTEGQKELLVLSELNNSGTAFGETDLLYADTEDYIYLMSYADATNKKYGFREEGVFADDKRVKQNTDYSYAMGAYMSTDGYYGGALWLTRSFGEADRVSGITGTGKVGEDYSFGVYYTGYGIVPMLKLNLCKVHDFENCVCSVCGTSKHNLEFVARKEADCVNNGNIEHWRCVDCGKKFLDEKGIDEIEEVTIYAHGHDYVKNICTVCRREATKQEKYWRVDENNVESDIGIYVYFGEYPQSLKKDDVIVTDVKDGRGYYLGSDDCYYAKVQAVNGNYSFADGTAVVADNVYYFKVEPIRWRVVSETIESITVICESILDVGVYDETENNYENSALRSWLNGSFYEKAFNSLQKSLLIETVISHAANTTASLVNPYAGTTTLDKVYVASYADLLKKDYGFSESVKNVPSDTVYDRSRQVSDFCIASGAFVDNDGNGWWWTRSPYAGDSDGASCVQPDGDLYAYRTVMKENTGIVPMITIRVS